MGNEMTPLEEVQMQFIADWEEGKSPTLTDYARRYPQFVDELTEFVLDYISIENAAARLPESPLSCEMQNRMDGFLSAVKGAEQAAQQGAAHRHPQARQIEAKPVD